MKASEKFYCKYEYLAKKYANKIFSYEELSFEYEDLVQEFRIKIFTSIKSYGRRWGKFRRGEAPRPVPIRYYLECACGNKARDFMKYISRENHKISINEIDFDYGVEQNNDIVPSRNRFIVNGVDLLEGLCGIERAVFSLFLRGYGINFIRKVYFSNKQRQQERKEDIKRGRTPVDVKSIIDSQREYLITKYGSDLMEANTVYTSYKTEEE